MKKVAHARVDEPVARPSVIEIRNLQKVFAARDGNPVQALSSVSLDIAKGEFLTIVGPSGCGKSTLLRLVAGLADPSEGELLLNGSPITGPQRDMGIVFQSPVLFPWRSVMDNVLLPADVLKLDRRDARNRAEELLEIVGLSDFAKKYPNELSGGMQQRVAIARALVHRPSVVLMDEPFGALDAMTRDTMNLEIMRIWREAGTTILFVTHSIPEAVFLGERVVVMTARPGKIAEVVDVDLPANRGIDIVNTDHFGTYARRIRNHFNARGLD
ncbi:ABC transporter ATP-binding protein [Roseovarius sp.]|jgi:NitT/TauT family transport system ATP-binding protein|uniref:ABC transporter ATP-binding protein n=1 Tax=Roseovarius sp. TaxID=1486281 RepID=UPI00261EE0CF|nr:ABC transporter ATP-binding protein [Roseovarius sp.]MDM8165670.1 ABC transporter ATP-binding protein [Roseovarius sp.]